MSVLASFFKLILVATINNTQRRGAIYKYLLNETKREIFETA